MCNFTCFASIFDEIEYVKRDLMYDPLEFKRTLFLVIQEASIKDAMQKFVFTDVFNLFMDKHRYENTNLYFLNSNGEISTFHEIIDI